MLPQLLPKKPSHCQQQKLAQWVVKYQWDVAPERTEEAADADAHCTQRQRVGHAAADAVQDDAAAHLPQYVEW